jgi:type IV pilus assembly protein PilM
LTSRPKSIILYYWDRIPIIGILLDHHGRGNNVDLSSLFGGGKKKLIGLDIGSSTIKMAELEVRGSSARLLSFNFLPTPQGAVAAGDIANVGAVAETVLMLKQKIKSKTSLVSLGLWGTSVIIKKISMPRVETKLIPQQVSWEAEQYIPFDPSEISLSYHLIHGPPNAETMDVLLVAAQNAIINQFSSAINAAGLGVGVLDVCGFALANCFELNYGRILGQTIALINIGSNTTNFVALYNGEVVFSRDVPFGGANYTLEIHKELGITIPEAEALKLSATSGGDVPDQVHQIIASINSNAIEEMRTSFDYFAASVPGLAVGKCYFTGGSSSIPGLISGISSSVGIQFEPLNPFLKVKPPPGFTPEYLQQLAPYSAIVIGLAMREAGDS